METTLLPFTFSHSGDFHLEEDRYLGDTAQCIEWFIEDSFRNGTTLFVLIGDLTHPQTDYPGTKIPGGRHESHGRPHAGHFDCREPRQGVAE